MIVTTMRSTTKSSTKDHKTESDTMDTKRRESLKKLTLAGVGTAASVHWYKPVVQSVALPAHARSSEDGVFFGDADELFESSGSILNMDPEELIASVERGPLDWLVEPAHALVTQTHLCVSVNAGSFSAQYQRGSREYLTRNGSVGDALNESKMTLICGCIGIFFTVDAVTQEGAMISIRIGKGDPVMKTISGSECNFLFGCVP